jgi:hypothetical protein
MTSTPVESIELFPGTNGNKYALVFECATVPYWPGFIA